MKSKEELFETIELYLGGNLKDQELRDFQEKLREDEELRKEVEIHRELNEAFSPSDEKSLRDTLQEISSEVELSEETPRGGSFRVWPIAASIALLAVAAFFLINIFFSTPSGFDEFYSPYPAKSITRGTSGGPQSEANIQYSQGNYAQAAILFAEAVDSDPEQTELYIYLGVSYLEVNDYAAAIESLSQIDINEKFGDDAAWYLAMTYLKTDMPEKAREQLEKIIAVQSKHTSNASRLLESL